MNPSIRRILARPLPGRRRIDRIQNHVIKINIITRMHVRTRNRRRSTLARIDRSCKIDKRHIRNTHQTRPGERPIIPIVLGNRRSGIGFLDIKVGEQDIGNTAPACTAGLTGALVGGLRDQRADPGLDVGAVVHVLIVSDDFDRVDGDVGDARVFQVLAQTADGDSVAAAAGHVVDVDVVGSWLDGDAVVAALVDEVG